MKKNADGTVDFVLFSTVMLLVAIGIVMVFSASSYTAGHSKSFNYDYMYFFKRQFLWAIIGFICMILISKFDYNKLKKLTLPILLLTIVLLVVVFGFEGINGATRWIRVGGIMSLQPSEVAKYAVVLYMAKSMEKKGKKIKKFFFGVVPYLLVAAFFAGLVLAEHNLSIAVVIVLVTIIMIFAAGANIWHLLALVPPLAALGVFFIKTQTYRMNRVTGFLHPFADPQKTGFQLVQSLLALGSGGILGVGLGKSRQKCYYLPEPHNDFIFSVIGEELGLIGCIIIILLFFILIWRGIRISVRAKNTYGTLLAVGIISIIAVQAIINIAVVTGSMPVTGVPLPFISYGGSSLVINMAAMGILLNISK